MKTRQTVQFVPLEEDPSCHAVDGSLTWAVLGWEVRAQQAWPLRLRQSRPQDARASPKVSGVVRSNAIPVTATPPQICLASIP